MDYTNNPDGPPSNRQPDNEDFRQLQVIHNHGHEGRQKPNLSDRFLKIKPKRGQMGKLIRSSSDGGAIVLEKDLGQGRKITTCIYRAKAR